MIVKVRKLSYKELEQSYKNALNTIERLNNIINQFEEYLKEYLKKYDNEFYNIYPAWSSKLDFCEIILNKIHKLKKENKN